MKRDWKILTLGFLFFLQKLMSHSQTSQHNKCTEVKATSLSSVTRAAALTCIFQHTTMISEYFKLGKDCCSTDK